MNLNVFTICAIMINLYLTTSGNNLVLNINNFVKISSPNFTYSKADLSPNRVENDQLPVKIHSFRDTFNRTVTSPKMLKSKDNQLYRWPVKKVSEVGGDIILGGLMMIHEREESQICGQIMAQGGIQALECMLYTLDIINSDKNFLPGIYLGAYILDDCDKDTYGLEQAVDFIKGNF